MRKSKPMSTRDGLLRVLSKVGANAYKLDLTRDMAVLATFNMGDLSPYVEDDFNFGDLRQILSKEGRMM